EGLYTAPSDGTLVSDILRMKELGFNLLRKHIKVEPERWYYHCDRLGMLVWQDMVSGGSDYHMGFVCTMPNLMTWTGRKVKDSHYRLFSREDISGRKEYYRELKGMIRVLYNHPSIVVWVPFNEGWGQFDASRATELIRSLDPNRLIDEASGWFDQGGGDMYSIHNYFRKLKIKPQKDRVVALTEFGGYSYLCGEHSACDRLYGYRTFRSSEELTEGIATLWERELIPAVTEGLGAAVYTQVSDIEDEVNGLLTYDRECCKVEEERMKELNRRLFERFEECVK
ncbi:MAG: glycoside hydrolase family 2, partial [Lachnospiraceae bacterium]|nr:glycoside hydrolase family 2 [Lachnospiraceae bacterium]